MAVFRLHRFSAWVPWLGGAFFIALQARAMGDDLAGILPDNADMLRLQQERDLLAGQSWFNVDQSRFLTPEGGEIHWSRLPDIFIGALVVLTRPFLGQEGAESFALVAYPLALFGCAFALVRLIAERLGAGLPGQIAAIILFALSSAALNFLPGRIDHHNLVLVLILCGLAALLSPKLSARSGIVAALSLVAAVSIAIDSLRYAGALILRFGLFWIARGHIEGVRLAVFGVSLAIFAAAFYAFDAPGVGSRRMVCDAYGTSHFGTFIGGGLLLSALGVVGGWLDGWGKRLAAGVFAGVLTLGLFAIVNPACLGDPYVEVSEQVRVAWLSVVGEAMSLMAVWENRPDSAAWQFGFVIAGLVAAIFVISTATAKKRLPTAALGLLLVLSMLATIWQIRGVYFSHAFAAIAGGVMLGALFSRREKEDDTASIALFVGAALFMSPTSWQMASRLVAKPQTAEPRVTPDGQSYGIACLDPVAYRALGDVPQSKVLTPIDLGMSLLIQTDHGVYGGPYHRNILGIERVTRAFMSAPDDALEEIKAMGATHVLYCAGSNETRRYARLAPGSLADDMENGRVPDWLEPADQAEGYDGVVRLYRFIAQ